MQPHPNNRKESSFTREKKQGIAASAVIHLLLAVFLLVFTFKVKPAMSVTVEEGLLVNFGFDETGDGLFEPAPLEEIAPPPEPSAGEQGADDAILTQDFEEAVEVKKKEPDPEQLKRDAEARIAEAKKREEAEAERKRIAQETAERVRREEEQRLRDQISNRTKNAFGNAGNVGESGTSEGIAGGAGNQGVETGTVGAPNYGPGGGPGKGISYSLGDRGFQSLPKPVYDIQKEGIVVVEISVDRSGKVTKAVAGIKGSTTLDDDLLKLAHDAAIKAKFDPNNNAPLLQKGNITYIFKFGGKL